MQQVTREFRATPLKQKEQQPQVVEGVKTEKPTFRDIALKRLEQLQEKRQRIVSANQSTALSEAVKTKGVDTSFEALARGEFRTTPQRQALKQEGEGILQRHKAAEKRVVADDIREDPLFQQKLGVEIKRQREIGGGIDVDEAEKNALAEFENEQKEKPEETATPTSVSDRLSSVEDRQFVLGKEFLESREQHALMMENIAAMLMATAESLKGGNEEEQNLSLLDLLIFLLQWAVGGVIGDELEEEDAVLLGSEV